jgi:dienelactone hydrolase
MVRLRSLLRLGLIPALLAPCALPDARAQGNAITYSPAGGRGHAVMLLSGDSGLNLYRSYADRLAQRGYLVVLLDGADILNPDRQGGQRLLAAIEYAQGDPRALPGKVAVIGFSRGGGGALAYATRMPQHVTLVVAYYPATSFIARHGDMSRFIGAMRVPVLTFAGVQDRYRDCCLIETAREMAADSRRLGRSFQLVEYPDAGHDFNIGANQLGPRVAGNSNFNGVAAADAWQRTISALQQYFGK